MANNFVVKNASNVDTTFKSTDNSGVHTPHHNVDSSALPTGASTSANQTTANASLSSIDGKLATLGSKADSGSSPVAWSTEGKAQLGSITETAPTTDTASSGLNGRMQRLAQRMTSLIGLLPASLGSKAASASLSVTKSTEDAALTGFLTETAPATDTASSGLNGRLQRIAQRLSSLISLFPTSLGGKTVANAFAVGLATDDPLTVAIGTKADAAATSDTGTFSLIALYKRMLQYQSDATPVSVRDGGQPYETVAASQTAQVMGASGAIGDVLAGVWIFPATTTPGAVAILDNATTIFTFPSGITLADTRPIFVPLGLVSASGAWKITTGTNVSCVAYGKFS